ncbi:hypothetical protein LOZ66_001633 [Ophidiomyces ophidiicola]|nr:hypothetical protein LOZ66_001633 [Ophidiomyces ophidiicola]
MADGKGSNVAATPSNPDAQNTPSVLQGLLALGTPLSRFALFPGEQIKLLCSNIRQMMGRKFDPEKDIVDQSGKVVLITGGNAGLGKEAVLQLAKHHPDRVYLAARNPDKAHAAIEEIQKALPQPADIRYLPLDLSSFPSVRRAAQQFVSDSDRLDTLILNAGIIAPQPSTAESGHELNLCTNHLGHFLLTKLLLPTLVKTAERENADVRVITIGSMAWQMAPPLSSILSTNTLLSENQYVRYGASKAANMVFAAELARRYPQLVSVSLHPGVIFTGLYDPTSAVNPVIGMSVKVLKLVTTSEQQGTLNHLWAAGSKIGTLKSGEYYTPVGVGGWKNKWVEDKEAGKKLWEWSEEAVSEFQKD